jgi:hypothetical protein
MRKPHSPAHVMARAARPTVGVGWDHEVRSVGESTLSCDASLVATPRRVDGQWLDSNPSSALAARSFSFQSVCSRMSFLSSSSEEDGCGGDARGESLHDLVNNLSSTDEATALEAASALWSLAEVEHNRARLAEAGAIPRLVDLLARRPSVGVDEACGVLGNLALCGENRREVVEIGGIVPLVELLSLPRFAAMAALVMRHLALTDSIAAAIVEAGALPILVEMLDSSSHSVAEAAAGVLTNLAVRRDCRELILFLQGVPALVALLGSPGGEAAEAAAALTNLSRDTDLQRAIAEAGAIGPLVDLLRSGSPSKELHAAGALWSLARREENRRRIAQSGAITALVPLVRSQAATQAAGALMQLAVRAVNRRLIAEAGGIDTLVNCLLPLCEDPLPADEALVVNVVGALCQLADRAENRALIAVHEEALRGMVQMLSWPSESVVLHAARALSKVALQPTCRPAVEEAGAVEPLVRLMGSSSGTVGDAVVKALLSLVESHEQRLAVVEGVDALLARPTEQALALLAALCQDVAIVDDALVAKVVTLLELPRPRSASVPESSSRTEARRFPRVESVLRIVQRLAKHASELLGAHGAVEAVLTHLLGEHLALAARTLGTLAKCPANKRRIVEAGGIPALISVVDSSFDSLTALRRLLHRYPLGRDELERVGGMQTIVRLCGSPNARLARQGLLMCLDMGIPSFSSPSKEDAMDALFVRSGGIASLIALLKSTRPRNVSQALAAVTRLAVNERLRLPIASSECVESLVRLLHHEQKRIVQGALVVLRVLALSPETRLSIQECKGSTESVRRVLPDFPELASVVLVQLSS